MHAWNVIADIAVPLKNHGVFFFISFIKLMKLKHVLIANSNLRKNIHFSAEHVFISSGYFYAATACEFP